MNESLLIIIIPIVLFLLALAIQKPVYSLFALILIEPFAGTEIINTQVINIPGMKFFNILTILVIILFVVLREKTTIMKYQNFFIVVSVILFTVAVFRSIFYISGVYNFIWLDEFSLAKYLLSHLIKPILIFLPFVLILLFKMEKEEIKKLFQALIISLTCLSIFLLFYYVVYIPDKSDFENVRLSFGKVLYLHGNDIADFYIAIFPIMIAYILSVKSKLAIMAASVSLLAVGILYSRTAYIIIVVSIFAFIFKSGRKKLVLASMLILLLIYISLPQTISNRLSYGIDSQNNANSISAGRTDDIWKPLIEELSHDPLQMIIGNGRYSVMNSQAFRNGYILVVGNAHNAYLESILDVGAIGLIFHVLSLLIFIYYMHKTDRIMPPGFERDMLIGCEISIVAFLFSCFSGRVFFPAPGNAFTWIVLAVGLLIANNYNKKLQDIKT